MNAHSFFRARLFRHRGGRYYGGMKFSASRDRLPTVAIIGGGFSGAAVAYHLHRLAPGRARIVVFEPRDALGRGLAYSAVDPAHRINVPAARMSIDPEDPLHFDRWLQASGALDRDPDARMPDGRDFPARRVFGDYMAATLRAAGQWIEHIRAEVEAIDQIDNGYRVAYAGSTLQADSVVLAVCHAPPAPPAGLPASVTGHPHHIGNPWIAGALDVIAADARVLIVGTGLTMADIVASLDRNGFAGSIVAISRRGLRSKGHPSESGDPYGDFLSPKLTTSLALLQSIRRSVRQAVRDGLSWHSVLDQVRLQGRGIWQNLDLTQRKRLLRHLRPFWDTHRFRIAPQPAAAIEQRLSDGRLVVRRARIASLAVEGDRFHVQFGERARDRLAADTFDYIVSATGPAHGTVFDSNPLLADLHARGLARPDPLRLGIDVDLDGRAIRSDGTSNGDLFVAGPLARGTFGELMGLPDVAVYAVQLAKAIARITQA